ncbi:D-alanyl-D-alanine carboxypeptidase [Salibacterium salarium]|nr:D-alanyl-D-alanine carboxypeptidase [Salibacterium salarium]
MNVWIIVVVLLLLIPTIFGILAKIIKLMEDKKNEQDVLKFIKNNPEKASIFAIYNDYPLLEYQADKKMPLASTLKIIIAIEFARQADIKAIDIKELVPLNELDKYFIKNSDGGAHLNWVESLRNNNQINQGQVSLFQVAKGMIEFSSNANMEFLINKLGLEKINQVLKILTLERHDPLFPISSANLICTYIQLKNGMTFKEALKEIKGMTYEKYANKAIEINQILKDDKEMALINQLNTKDIYNNRFQVIASQKQPTSTTKEYANLMQAIRKRKFLTSNAQDILQEIMNIIPNEGSSLIDLGLKGGSSISILTTAFYSKDEDGNTMDMAIFIHDPSRMDLLWIQNKFNLFIGKFATDKRFREEVVRTLDVE